MSSFSPQLNTRNSTADRQIGKICFQSIRPMLTNSNDHPDPPHPVSPTSTLTASDD